MKDGEKEMKVQGGDEVVVRRKNEVNEREKETLIMERENPPKVENNTSHGGKKILPWKGFAAARFYFFGQWLLLVFFIAWTFGPQTIYPIEFFVSLSMGP